ncbi:hypothetical protein [Pseudomonas sp. HMWF021]|jgi:hypothetical protein|uniref:hypothetical protein n=1 Tax=Pseudomonas sp. HMWF021 TaxID=2056857 RepID=UPI000D337D7B|nr:hypothetical protein [Pseudomonas sp. HMWF021]PTT24771.1 hypothetical protein DBR18_26705 [Pseudomonas sp. HMWF021]
MLVIRSAQMNTLAQSMLRRQMRQQLQSFWAPLADQLHDKGVETFIEHALERCSFYEIDTEVDHMRYLNTMAVLGATFDEDHEWAKRILDVRAVHGSSRMDELCDAVICKLTS